MRSLPLIAAGICLLLGVRTAAAGPPDSIPADLWQTLRARQALWEDRSLAPLNLGVRVRGRVAVLWGPVPSVELALRAETRLRGLVELIDVRNELIVMTDDLRDVPREIAPPAEPQRVPLPEPRPFLRLHTEPRAPFARQPRASSLLLALHVDD